MTIIHKSLITLAFTVLSAGATATASAQTHNEADHAHGGAGHSHNEPAPDPSYARSGGTLSYFSTPNRNHTEISADAAVTLGAVDFEVRKPSDVLIQFTSGLATVVPEGCPCSARASIKVDDREPVVIKRVNLGTAITNVDGKYQPDRQSADGSFALPLPPGKHRVALIVQRIEGKSALLHAFYPNIQVLVFPATK